MAYVDRDYYVSGFLLGRDPDIPEKEFPYWEKQAEKEIDRITFGRLRENALRVTDDVKDCVCAVAELLYRSGAADQAARSAGLAGPLKSWSNDGDSGSIEVEQSMYIGSGRNAEIQRLAGLYIGDTGLLYKGVIE